MATTNATINQAQRALVNLQGAATAQNAAAMGQNVAGNVNTTARKLQVASEALTQASVNAKNLGLKNVYNKFMTASNHARRASIVASVQATVEAMTGMEKAMQTNIARLNKNQPLASGAGSS